MERRTVVVDCTPREAQTIAAILDLGSTIADCCSGDYSAEMIRELRDRFTRGVAIAKAEEALRL